MNPIKWLRKNERKVMTVVVILIMIAFIGGTALQQLMSRVDPNKKTVAFYGQKSKITPMDLRAAQSELDVLNVLGMPRLLVGMNDISAELLGQILFGSDSQMSVYVSDMVKQRILQGQLSARISDVDKFFLQAGGQSELYWLLLKAEARSAGCVIPLERARSTLKVIIPQLMQGSDAGQLVDAIVARHRVTEEDIMRTVANLLGILSYSKMVTGNEELTIAQIRSAIGRGGEKIDAEFIKIDAINFIDQVAARSDKKIAEQFNLYKTITSGLYSDDNTFGFGYKLPAMAALEYILVNLEDVKALLEDAAQEEMEDFYRQNRDNPDYSRIFQYTFRKDPNNPASELTQVRTYSQAQGLIKAHLKEQRTSSTADMIFNRAGELTDAGFDGEDIDGFDSDKLKSLAADYADAAAKLKSEFNLEVYTGKTGMLSIEDFSKTQYLSGMAVRGQSSMPTPLSRLVFSVDEIGLTTLGRFDASRPRMWSNIGPMKDRFGSIMAMVRIISAQKSVEPENIDLKFSKNGIKLDKTDSEPEAYSLKEAVERDCKLIEAMSIAKTHADELAAAVGENGWDEGVKKFNEKYFSDESKKLNALTIEKITGQSRISLADTEMTKTLESDFPDIADNMREALNSGRLASQLYSLLPAGETKGVNLRTIIEFAPNQCCYLVKDVSRVEINELEYFGAKKMLAYQEDISRSGSLSLVHFMPENIRTRMEFRNAEADEETSQENSVKTEDSN
jgi:hypothetical protein